MRARDTASTVCGTAVVLTVAVLVTIHQRMLAGTPNRAVHAHLRPAAWLRSATSGLAEAKAVLYAQLSVADARRPGREWLALNEELRQHRYQLVLLVADPAKWSLLTIGTCL